VALPEIARLVEGTSDQTATLDLWDAYDLAMEAEAVIPGDPLLEELWPECARALHIRSTPPGARVYAKAYADIDGEWRVMGETPLDVRFPKGYARLKLEKEGFDTVLDLVFNTPWLGDTVSLELPQPEAVPPGMVWVPVSDRELRLPGLEGIERERVPGFWIDRFEVSNADYKRFVDAGGYRERGYWKYPFIEGGQTLTWEEAMERFRDRTGRPGPATWEVGDYPEGTGNDPVGGLSWHEAAAYAEFAGKRLPTVFHWNAVAFTWATPAIVSLANFEDAGPWPVDSDDVLHTAGACNLAGNVREWCWNETNRENERLILGGGWNDGPYAFNDAYAQPVFDRSATNGFRCIRYADDEPVSDRLDQLIELPYRDFSVEKPVGDDEFRFILKQYAYDKSDLQAKIEEEQDADDWIRQTITFDAAYGGERMMAYLFLPKQGTPPYQTVVYFPGSGVIYVRSSDGNLSVSAFDFFIKSGRALMYPIYKGTFERGGALPHDQPSKAVWWREYTIMWAKDLARSIDYLETRDDIDRSKLAYFGRSWGARMGPLMLAVEDRLSLGMLYVGGLKFARSLPEADTFNFAPRVTVPVLMVNGEYDFFYPVETAQRPLYEFLGTPQADKRWVVYDGGHSVPRNKLIEETLGWLDRYFGAVE
jgi:dienelactone hydrolase